MHHHLMKYPKIKVGQSGIFARIYKKNKVNSIKSYKARINKMLTGIRVVKARESIRIQYKRGNLIKRFYLSLSVCCASFSS